MCLMPYFKQFIRSSAKLRNQAQNEKLYPLNIIQYNLIYKKLIINIIELMDKN